MKRIADSRLLRCFGLALGSAAPAAELAGVTMPDTDTVEGKTLKLNGLGLRKKMVFKVYVAGLYLETPVEGRGGDPRLGRGQAGCTSTILRA